LLWGEEIGHPEFQFRPHFNSSRSGLKTGFPVWCVVPWQSAFSQRGRLSKRVPLLRRARGATAGGVPNFVSAPSSSCSGALDPQLQ
jgi:hypothetical protein